MILVSFSPLRYPRLITQPEQKLTPAEPDDLADSLSFALRHEGRKSQHDSDKLNTVGARVTARATEQTIRQPDTAPSAHRQSRNSDKTVTFVCGSVQSKKMDSRNSMSLMALNELGN